MNREELLNQINEWHEVNEHQKIIDTIEALPQEEWDYELTCLLARAYNNVSPEPCDWHRDLGKAVALLESVWEDGKDDACWHFRLGYALFFLDRVAEALPCFRRAAELDPEDPDAPFFIQECEKALAEKAEKDAVTFELAKALMSYLGCECEYFPPMRDDDPIMAAYNNAFRLAPEKGFVPMLITVDETLWECLIMNSDPDNDGADGYGFDPKTVAAYRAEQLSQPVPDGKTILKDRIGDRKGEIEDCGMDWDEEVLGEMEGGEANNRFAGIWNYGRSKTYPLILAEIPVKNPWEIFAYLPFGAWNDCPDTPSLMAAAKHWYEKYGAVPAVMTHDVLEFIVPQPVSSEAAMELALEQYGFCADIVSQGPEDATVGWLADILRQSTVWYFWWD